MSRKKFSKEFKLKLLKEHDEKGISCCASLSLTYN